MCNSLFGGNTCTWVLILVIIFLLSQSDSGCGYSNGCGCARDNDCGCTGYTTHTCC